MDAETRNLLLLGILSGFCAVFAWSLDYPIWASVFLAFCLAAFFAAIERHWR
jgi:hypothetical protein